ncbi:hypothetical protein [Pseudofrankia sp. DC12]|uniref:hypothetical protein n=1 Tax=Pseudofrankia sp. DC12 TaxID=683315 RepID=UPI0018DB670C|nr:hypothetical protein [Pseudofrankia sp. DC12]
MINPDCYLAAALGHTSPVSAVFLVCYGAALVAYGRALPGPTDPVDGPRGNGETAAYAG